MIFADSEFLNLKFKRPKPLNNVHLVSLQLSLFDIHENLTRVTGNIYVRIAQISVQAVECQTKNLRVVAPPLRS